MWNILLVEDDECAAVLFRRIVESSRPSEITVRVAEGGNAAIDYLAGRGVYSDRLSYPVPDLIVLDLLMPGVNGFDVLDWRQTRPEWSSIPVVVFSGSSSEVDQQKCMAKGATHFVRKPNDYPSLKAAVAEILSFSPKQAE